MVSGVDCHTSESELQTEGIYSTYLIATEFLFITIQQSPASALTSHCGFYNALLWASFGETQRHIAAQYEV